MTGGGDLKRVTILSARPDSTVVVQADYFSAALTVSADSRMSTEPATTSHILKPTQLYARTQRGFEDTKPSVLDVLA